MISDDGDSFPSGAPGGKYIRGAINAASGAIPFAGGIISALSGFWSEAEQEKVNQFFRHWIRMMQAELEEKQQTIIEIIERLDMHDQAIADRVSSKEYQSLIQKAFRDWSGTESEEKRILIRGILANAAYPNVVSDDVIRMFIQWIGTYSEMHFAVIASIYKNPGATRGRIWEELGKSEVREDSADADLFKLLIRDLSTGGIIRQHREKDYAGNFVRQPARRPRRGVSISNTVESAFEDTKGYELTELGAQFVHFAMTDIPLKLQYHSSPDPDIQSSGGEEP